MSTTAELKAKISKMTQELQAIEAKERSEAIAKVRELIAQYGLEASEIGLGTSKRKVAGKRASVERPALYRDPKTGDTWNGWGKPPGWIPKDKPKRVRFLIVKPEAAQAEDAGAVAKTAAAKKAAPVSERVAKAATRKVASKTSKPGAKKALSKAAKQGTTPSEGSAG